MYSTKILTEEDYDFFEELYNDFYTKAKTEYNFELEPLDFDGFLDAVEKNIVKCIILYDNHKAVGFLVYTTAISEAVELNIIHCLPNENFENYASELLNKFLELTEDIRKQKIVCYPMLGIQEKLIGEIVKHKFQFVGIEVLRFKFKGTNSKDLFQHARVAEIPPGYSVVKWNTIYFEDAVRVVQKAFKDSSDALFDPRFKSLRGCRDILTKIVRDIYAQFLPEATSVLLYDGKPVGFAFMNITNDSIVNIPIVGIKNNHQGKGLSTIMLKHSVEVILNKAKHSDISEINTTTETNNLQALRLYKNLGFIEDYSYPQAYLPVLQ